MMLHPLLMMMTSCQEQIKLLPELGSVGGRETSCREREREILNKASNLKMKWCITQQLLVLRQNRLYQCVHHVVGIIRKILVC